MSSNETHLRSSLHDYRVITAYGGKFSWEKKRPCETEWFHCGGTYDSVEEVLERIRLRIAEDEFVPQVVKLEAHHAS